MRLDKIMAHLPIAGIIVFALCSVNALGYFFLGYAKHETPVYWGAAVLVEGFTAWLIASAVGIFHRLLDSRAKRDRRFNAGVLCAYIVLAVPTLTVSFLANRAEFGGNPWLGMLFPSLCVGCAVGGGVPAAIARFEERKAAERARRAAEREREQVQVERRRIANIADWRAIYANGNGGFADARAADVEAALTDAGFALPSPRTLQGWAQEAREGRNGRT